MPQPKPKPVLSLLNIFYQLIQIYLNCLFSKPMDYLNNIGKKSSINKKLILAKAYFQLQSKIIKRQ